MAAEPDAEPKAPTVPQPVDPPARPRADLTLRVADQRRTLGLPPAARLRRRPEIQRVQRGGVRRAGRLLVVLALPSTAQAPRMGLAVSRKVGNAVVRNRVKRRLREVWRHLRVQLPAMDVLVIARTSAAQASFGALRAELIRSCEGLADVIRERASDASTR